MSAVEIMQEQNNNEDQKACGSSDGPQTTPNAPVTTLPPSEGAKEASQDEIIALADHYKNQGNDYLKGE